MHLFISVREPMTDQGNDWTKVQPNEPMNYLKEYGLGITI